GWLQVQPLAYARGTAPTHSKRRSLINSPASHCHFPAPHFPFDGAIHRSFRATLYHFLACFRGSSFGLTILIHLISLSKSLPFALSVVSTRGVIYAKLINLSRFDLTLYSRIN